MTFGPVVRAAARGILAAALTLAISCNSSATTSPTPTGSSDTSASPDASSLESAIPTPRTTPPGTPAPTPDTVTVDSAAIDPAQIDKAVPAPTPTPAPEAGLWRIDGYVVDDTGTPLAGVCVVIGPHGCQKWSPHTNDRGYWFIDIAEGHATFDFYFEMPGKKSVWWHTTPEGPTEFNVRLVNG